MDLWIRTQKREDMFKVNNLQTQGGVIYTYLNDDGNYTLGEYETPRRAKEVLDEIQKLLVGDVLLFKNVDIDGELGKYLEPSKALWLDDKTEKPQIEYLHRDCIVYEMPLE